jgi:hypothetical protein
MRASVMNETQEEAEQKIETALKARKVRVREKS